MGYRVSEVDLPRTKEHRGAIKEGGRSQSKRSVNFANLPDVPDIPYVAPVSPDRNDLDTAIEGVKKRYARVVPEMKAKHHDAMRKFVREWCQRNLVPISDVMGFDDWLESTSYNGPRKDQLREIKDRWVRGDVNPKKLSTVKSHIKCESYPQYKHARHINARCDLAKVVFGPIIKTLEREVYSRPEFIKHVPLFERPELLRKLKQAGCSYVASDHTAYEAHMSFWVMELIEFEIARWLLRRFPRLAELFEATESGINRCHLNAVDLTVLIQYIRCSGDMWTSLMNGLVNLLSFLYACDAINTRFCGGFVEGDDGIFAVQGTPPTAEFMEELGFEVKFETHDDPATASFCGMILAGHSIIRDPSKFFQTFGWSDRFMSGGRKVKRQLALAKSLSALYETPGCPLVSHAARYVYENTKGVVPRFIQGAYKTVPADFHPPDVQVSDEARELFARLYGISPACQVSAEERIMRGDWSAVTECVRFHPHVADYAARYVEVS